MMPTRLELDLAGGQYRADRDRLLRLVFALENGLADGTAPTYWRELLKAAKRMREQDGRGDHDGAR